MPGTSWQETIVNSYADGPALTASVAATSLLPTSAKPVLPLSQLLTRVGKVLKITAQGRISNVVTTPGTLTFDVRMGTGPVIVFNGGAISLNTVAKTNVKFWLEILLTLRSLGTGTAAQFAGAGQFSSESVVGSAAGVANCALLPVAGGASPLGTGFDSTSSSVIDLFGTWSLNNANSITVEQFKIEDLTS